MGTFHHDKGELHGITVVVDTKAEELWVGRCDTVTEAHVVLLGADHRAAGDTAPGRDDWLRRAAMVGVHPNHVRVVLPLTEVESIRKQSDVSLV